MTSSKQPGTGAELPPKWRPGLLFGRHPDGGITVIDTDKYDGTAEDGDRTEGYGKTKAEAVADLEEQYAWNESR